MELSSVLIVIFCFVLVRTWLEHRDRRHQERVRLLEQAIGQGGADRATLEQLARQVGGRGVGGVTSGLMALLLGIGWLSLFVGIALWVVSGIVNDREMHIGGVVTTIVGFALVTYPFALRELELRRAR